MRIRLKEFAPHIIVMTIVFIFMIAASFFYTTLVATTLHESVYSQVKADATSYAMDISKNAQVIREDYIDNNTSYTIVSIDDSNEVVGNVNLYGFFIDTEADVESTTDTTVYAYIRIVSDETNYIKVSLETLISDFLLKNSDEYYAIVSYTGNVAYGCGISTGSSLFQQLLNNNTSETIKDLFKVAMQSYETSYAHIITYNSTQRYMGISVISPGYYLAYITNTSAYASVVNSFNVLTAIYRLSLSISFLIIFIDLALIVFRSNRLLTIRRTNAAKHGTAVIKVNKKGKVKFYARGRDTFGIEVNDLEIFKPVSGKTFSDSLKSENRFIASYVAKDETLNYVEFVVVPNQGGYVVISNIITEEYNKDLELKILTEHNSISNLPNRNALFKNFDELKSGFFRNQVTLARIKLVEFEDVSKTLGYTSGDKLLLELIKVIQSKMDENMHLYQDENDTLIMILVGSYQKNDEFLNRLLNSFNKPIPLIKSTIFVHLKIGSIELKNVLNKDFSLKDAIDKVSIALNRANEQVSIPLVKYDSNLETYVNYRNTMEEDMHKAIENDEFVMYYQPQYNIHDRRIEGFESLIRWDNPKYKSVSPQVYIELAEKNGDIVEIGRFINRSVFKAAKTFEQFGVHLSINVSPAQLIQSGFIDELLTEFKKNNLKKGSVCVEITETYVMQNYTLMIEKLNILRNAGFSIHLDDFGTGYSSMLYLKELPIDTIKTDMEFIRNLESDNVSQVIESQVIKIAKSLDLKVICEGVERDTQVELLQKYGADYLQGYLVSKAVPMDKALDMVKNGVDIPGLKGR